MIEVIPVRAGKQLKQFIDFPHILYKDDPLYVPELYIAQRDLLTPGKHPFHEHSVVQPFLALRNGEVVGRIAAILNNNHNNFNGTQDGFFGFFDTINDHEVASGLLTTAQQWLKEKGARTIIGPANFSTNETCGLLVQGFDSSPVAMMPYNRPYYMNLLEDAGFSKKVDLYAYRITAEQLNERPYRLMQALMQRLKQRNIVIRKINTRNFAEEARKIREVYNKAWDKNLGFVPMTDKEFDYLAKDLKLILDDDFCILAELEGQIIGFALCIPDINQILRGIRKGRLFPFGIFKLLTQRKSIKAVRIIALGVLEPYRKMGIEACFYGTIMEQGRKKGINWAEASWILEHNTMMNKAVIDINGELYKKYRIYEKAI